MESNGAHNNNAIENESLSVLEDGAVPERNCQQESVTELEDPTDKVADSPVGETSNGSSPPFDWEEEKLSKLLLEINCEFKAMEEKRNQPSHQVQPKGQAAKNISKNQGVFPSGNLRKTGEDDNNCPLRTGMKRKLNLDRRWMDSKHRYEPGGRSVTQKCSNNDKPATFGGIDAKRFRSHLQENNEKNTMIATKERIVKICNENPNSRSPETTMIIELRKRKLSTMDVVEPSEKIIKLSDPPDTDIKGEIPNEEGATGKQENK